MKHGGSWRAGLLAAGLVLTCGRAGAQTVTGQQQLDFGTVFPGVPEVVPRTNAAQAGRFDIRGTSRAEVRVSLALPAALTATGGRTLPLQFGPNDGGYFTQNQIGSAIAFDPRAALVTRVHPNGRLYIWLGGTARPTPTQGAGSYTGTITLTVQYTGN